MCSKYFNFWFISLPYFCCELQKRQEMNLQFTDSKPWGSDKKVIKPNTCPKFQGIDKFLKILVASFTYFIIINLKSTTRKKNIMCCSISCLSKSYRYGIFLT